MAKMHSSIAIRVTFAFLASASLSAARAGAQISLGDALREADRSSYGNRIARGSADVQSAQTLSPLKGILPSVRFEGGYLRTTDPIGVFGATLRQRAVSPANFEPQRLNYPPAIGNYQSAIVLEQPLFNADAWNGRTAAIRSARASLARQDWTGLTIRVEVVRAYYGAVLAMERSATLQASANAAHAHVRQAEAMVRQGLVTKSDALLAAVRAGDIDAQLAEARGNATTALRQLAVALGRDGTLSRDMTATAHLPTTNRIRAVITAADTMETVPAPRADLRAASEGLAAARADERRARSAYLPRLNSFARYDWNSPDRLYGGDRNWTVGILASWSPFTGASEIGDIRAATGRVKIAEAQAAAARATAHLEVEQTRTVLMVALTRLEIAERAVAQSAEAHRIVGRKYEGGLATVTELLDAQAAETQSALALSQARWSTIIAAAERRLALGGDPGSLQALDDVVPDGSASQQTSIGSDHND